MDQFVDFVIISSSLALLCYWFRYICLLILTAEPTLDYAEEIARAYRLVFPEIRSRLRQRDATNLCKLHELLNRDFAVIRYLADQASFSTPDGATEHTLLKIHFRIMSTWFRLSCGKFPDLAGRTLDEMSRVVAHLANAMGERRASHAAS